MIEVKNITKRYGKFTAVDDISFDVKDGEIVGFLGPNGAGKSTTMNMITGFIEPNEGSIIINGYNMAKKPKKAKKQIGYMPENIPLYQELTVREFVNYMAELKLVRRKNRKEEINKILEKRGLTEVQKKLIKNLSRGYNQRVSMAGALVGNPDVLILDEPTVGLDPKQITEIRKLIKELGKEHTVILSTHILSEVSQICERVVIINHGKIIAIDTPENLEQKTQEKNSILLTVEDKKQNMQHLKEQIPEIQSLKFVKDNEDGTKQYMIESDAKVDLRKKLFEVLPKQDITIFELKKAENTLEDAFISLIDETQKEETKEGIKENTKKEEKDSQKQKKHKEKEQSKNAKKEFNKQKEDKTKGGKK